MAASRKKATKPPAPPKSKTFKLGISVRGKYAPLIELFKNIQDSGDKSRIACDLMMDGLRLRELGNTDEQIGYDNTRQVSTVANLLVQAVNATGEGAEERLDDDLDAVLFKNL